MTSLPPPPAVRLALTTVWLPLRVVHSASCPEIGPLCATQTFDDYVHDQRLHALEIRASAQLGLTENFALELRLPLRVTASDITYRNPDGSRLTDAPHGRLHHRDEVLVGPGDLWFLAQTAWDLGAVRWGGFVGLTAPLGRTEANPFTAGESGLEHQHIQDGTGTVDPVLGAHVAVPFAGAFGLLAHVQSRVVMYANSDGYQAGRNLEAGLGVDGTIDVFTGGLSLDVLHLGPERWDGEIQQDGNRGATTLLIGLSASVQAGPISVGLTAKIPVFQHLVGGPEHGDVSYPLILGLRVTGLVGGETD